MKRSKTKVIHGTGIGSRCAVGKLHFLHTPLQKQVKKGQGIEEERARLYEAISFVMRSIAHLQKTAEEEIGADAAEIFAIHAMLLEDEDLIERMELSLLEGFSAEAAVGAARDSLASELAALDDPYLRARAADIGDVCSQLLEHLSGKNESTQQQTDEPYILVARDLTPSQTVGLDRATLLGFVTFEGSPNSHTAILARAMGIPALVCTGEISELYDNTVALLDAATGVLTLSPSEEEKAVFSERCAKNAEIASERERALHALLDKPAITKSGHHILVYANVGGEEELDAVLSGGADGIGLLRSEFLYLSLDRAPDEERLYQNYRAVAERMQGRRVVIRTLDIGADKQVSYLSLPHEENPALGLRGVRLCLRERTLFCEQIRAILRASAHGKVALMLPMIVSVDEVRACRELIVECMQTLSARGQKYDKDLEIGIMIETPAAALMCRELAAEVDFFSVGTNDLTQYTLAADRQNPNLFELCRDNLEPVLRLIEMAAKNAHGAGIWIGICGELAADTSLTDRFLAMGIDELSVAPPCVLTLRERITETE
ncbi:MAG: phosphoenolpyruvate--protein phosphotransferase [Clostridia bacterium]|nr:phosphoenolpyruvate--protein phosphotransferase [Clostridia bacterium]